MRLWNRTAADRPPPDCCSSKSPLGCVQALQRLIRAQVYISRKIGILSESQFPPLVTDRKEIAKILQGLRKSLKAENQFFNSLLGNEFVVVSMRANPNPLNPIRGINSYRSIVHPNTC